MHKSSCFGLSVSNPQRSLGAKCLIVFQVTKTRHTCERSFQCLKGCAYLFESSRVGIKWVWKMVESGFEPGSFVQIVEIHHLIGFHRTKPHKYLPGWRLSHQKLMLKCLRGSVSANCLFGPRVPRILTPQSYKTGSCLRKWFFFIV